MELIRRIRWIAAGIGAVALTAAAPAAAWADQSNDNSTSTTATGASILAPITPAVQLNLDCPVNLNVLGSQRDAGNCAPGAQANSNSSSTAVDGGDQLLGLVAGPVVAPVTAALQANVSCPVNVNILSGQHGSGNCAPGPQANSNTAATQVSGPATGLLGGPLVAPVTTGVGLNVTCPANVNVLSAQDSSGGCVGDDTTMASAPQDAPPAADAPPQGGGTDSSSAASVPPTVTDAVPDASTSFSDAPGPPATGALTLGRTPAGFPVLGLLVLAGLAVAAMTVRRLRQER